MSDEPPIIVLPPTPDPPPPLEPPPVFEPPVPTIDVLIQKSDRLIVGYGYLPAGTDDPSMEVVAVDATEAPKLNQPGTKYLDENNQIMVVPLGTDYAGIAEQRRRAEAQAQAELLAQENPDYLVILKASGSL